MSLSAGGGAALLDRRECARERVTPTGEPCLSSVGVLTGMASAGGNDGRGSDLQRAAQGCPSQGVG
jgi:hypothetical protein